ncbi:MAG TPA: class I SAM-dependent methyltransferase [Flavobacterium sp.]|nr:class I SAM-dependent methyltransferase [Flavobacterium sp.]
MKDIIGKAIFDYQTGNSPENLITETSISEADEMDVSYLFRSYEVMPKLEQKALQMAQGKVLDIGCGAGSHALYLQNEKGLNVTAVDISEKSVETCRLRGVKNINVQNFMTIDNETFDTVLLLMNGTGICGKLDNLPIFLQKLKSLINPNGQILIDSSDIIYMFDEDEDGGKWIPGEVDYYGEVVFYVSYKGEKEEPFNWLYLDYNTLQNAAYDNGLSCELIAEGENYDYLAVMKHS